MDDVVRRARALIGVRFRPQGRTVKAGLDCIGVVAMAFGLTAVRGDYALRSGNADVVNGEFASSGFLPIPPAEAGAGDVLLVRTGFRQLHVVILTVDGYLHADAALRRVVEVPGAVAWPVKGAWRHPDRSKDPHPARLRATTPLPLAGEG